MMIMKVLGCISMLAIAAICISCATSQPVVVGTGKDKVMPVRMIFLAEDFHRMIDTIMKRAQTVDNTREVLRERHPNYQHPNESKYDETCERMYEALQKIQLELGDEIVELQQILTTHPIPQ